MVKTVVFSVLVHSCLVESNLRVKKYLQPGNKYLIMGMSDTNDVWYRLLPKKCQCRKEVTKEEANRLVATGEANPIYKLKRGNIEIDFNTIWMAQQRQVPRVDLISRTDLERAYLDLDPEALAYIEEVHQLYVSNRAKLIVPYEEEDNSVVARRLIFCFGPEQRTKGGHAL